MKEKDWINSAMSSMDDLRRVSPPTDLFHKIEAKIEVVPKKVIPLRWLIGVAASFLILVSINAFAIYKNYSNTTDNLTTDNLELLKSEIESNNYLY